MELKVCSFNCCSLRKNINVIRKLTEEKYDVIFLQETFISDEKLGELDYIDDHYQSIGVRAKLSQKSLESMAGRPEGGMVCLWRTSAVFNIDKVILEKNICVLCLGINTKKILLVNVYLNSVSWESATLANYLESLSRLEEILSDFNFDGVYLLGDFNADPFSGRAWHSLNDFMTRNYLKCFDYEVLDHSTFTFMSYGIPFVNGWTI